MEPEELREEFRSIIFPEMDEDGQMPLEFPNERLSKLYGLDFTYMKTPDWEGSSLHRYTRVSQGGDEKLDPLMQNADVPTSLFTAALLLFGDSIAEYHGRDERTGPLRYYPPAVLAFWSGLETFIRKQSELLLAVAKELPPEIGCYLREQEQVVGRAGNIESRAKFRSPLDRYAVFLRYAYDYRAERGASWWQRLEEAKRLRDYYAHPDVRDPQSVSTRSVLDFMEAVLLAIIVPSSHLQRTMLLGIYYLYDAWSYLNQHCEAFAEKPMHMGWKCSEPHLIHCNFENVDTDRFPTMQDYLRRCESVRLRAGPSGSGLD